MTKLCQFKKQANLRFEENWEKLILDNKSVLFDENLQQK